MHIFVDEQELSGFLAGLTGGEHVRSPRVAVVSGGVEVRAAVGKGALGVRVGLSCEPGRGLHLDLTVLEPSGDAGDHKPASR
jgi:hypothetical protein